MRARTCGHSVNQRGVELVYRHTPADCIIPGASRFDQYRENLAALEDGPLAPELLETCDAIWAKLRGVTPQYIVRHGVSRDSSLRKPGGWSEPTGTP